MGPVSTTGTTKEPTVSMTTSRNRRAVARILAEKAKHVVYVTTGVGNAAAHCYACGTLAKFLAPQDGGDNFSANFNNAFDVADIHRAAKGVAA